MSTAAVTPSITSSKFGFASVGHFFAAAFGDLKKAIRYTETVVLPDAQKAVETAEIGTAALSTVLPQAGTALVVERAIDAAAGELLAAVHTTDAISGADFVDLKLPLASYQAFKQFIEDQKDALAKLGYKL